MTNGHRYDFDRIIDRRGTSSLKWDQLETLFGGEDVLPLFVADMDFEAPREVVEAIVEAGEARRLRLHDPNRRYYEAVTGWLERRHGWAIEREWLVSSPGVVPALAAAIHAFTEPGDGVILQSPVYYPFYDVIRANGRTIVDNPLRIEDGVYRIDFDLLEEQAKSAKLMLLCSPHNPGGRVWTADELKRIGDICLRHGVIVVSDEIHHDLVFAPHKHVPFASLGPEYAERSITCIAPSKTFNLAGAGGGGDCAGRRAATGVSADRPPRIVDSHGQLLRRDRHGDELPVRRAVAGAAARLSAGEPGCARRVL